MEKMYEVIIIGGGPTGSTLGCYLCINATPNPRLFAAILK